MYKKVSEELLNALKTGALTEEQKQSAFVQADLSGTDFSGLNCSHINFEGSLLFKVNFSHSELFSANFSNADCTGSNFDKANATNAIFERTGLGHCHFENSVLFSASFREASLTGAVCINSDFRTGDLHSCRMRDATFTECDFTGSTMTKTELCCSDVAHSDFREVNFEDAQFRGLKGYGTARWIGADIRQVNFSGGYRIRRVIVDQNYLEEFRSESRLHEFLYRMWWLTSDCGRSMVRWTLLVLFCIILFGIMYTFIDIDMGIHPTPFSPFYFSVVTMTTLGFGDVIPRSVPAQIIVSIQVLMGYIMLGGLLALLTNKIARRAD